MLVVRKIIAIFHGVIEAFASVSDDGRLRPRAPSTLLDKVPSVPVRKTLAVQVSSEEIYRLNCR